MDDGYMKVDQVFERLISVNQFGAPGQFYCQIRGWDIIGKKEVFMATITNRQRIIQSTVRAILSLGGHAGAIAAIYYSTTNNGGKPLFTVPEWLPAMFALVITWYFATNETEKGDKLPHWQATLRALVRASHALVGAFALALLLITRHEIPKWWIATYLSILTFYFIELRDPPEEVE
jgi:hypothetical protein